MCSDDSAASHIAPLMIHGDPAAAWRALSEHLQSRQDFRLTGNGEGHLQAQAITPICRFVDDVEFQLRPAENIIAVRSASRLGYWDFGTNRRRIESIRTELINLGVVQPPRR